MTRFTPFLDWIAAQDTVMRDRLALWANINSYTDNLPGLAKMADVLVRDFVNVGTLARIALAPGARIDSHGNSVVRPLGEALHLRLRPEAPRQVFLNIHMDTVYPADGPFQSVTPLDAGMLRGPGVTDAKGGLVILLTCLEMLERTPWVKDLGCEILINPDEEIGSPGSLPLFEQAAGRNQIGLLFEPAQAGGTLVSHRRGLGNFTFVIRGLAAHSGRDFDKGRSAVVALADLVTQLHALNAAHPSIIVNVGRVEGGGAVNIVPDLAIAHVNVRTTERADEALLRGAFEALAARIGAREGITCELHGSFPAPPKPLDPRTRSLLQSITDCGSELGLQLGWRQTGGVSDGNRLAAWGLTNVDSLGPRGGNIHNPQEYIHLDSLVERAHVAGLFLLKFAAGQIPWPPL
jgi:glutamate carboxypeptidase